MTDISINLDLFYTDITDDLNRRAALAAEDGLRHVEIWHWSDKDLAALRRSLDDNGLSLCSMLLEPRTSMSTATDLAPFFEGLKRSAEAANVLGSPIIVASSEEATPARKRAEQHSRVVDVLGQASEVLSGSGVKLALENVNSRVDHPGVLLDLATDCAEIARQVDSESVVLLVDLYHALVMKEDVAEVLSAAQGRIAHVQIAGVPGRAEPKPGAGNPWPMVLQQLDAVGYTGPVGLEYFPELPSRQSLEVARQALAET